MLFRNGYDVSEEDGDGGGLEREDEGFSGELGLTASGGGSVSEAGSGYWGMGG
jgi:hypothetical protein